MQKERKRGGYRDGLVAEMKRQGGGWGGRGVRGGVPFSEAVCWMWGSLSTSMEPGVCLMWKLDSLNPSPLIFHNLRIPHGGPHIPLIRYKLVFFVLSLPWFKPPLHLFFSTLLRYQWVFFFFIHIFFSNIFSSWRPLAHWMELQFHPWCLSVSHQHKTSLTLPLRHLLYSERRALSAARLVFKTNKQNNGTTDLSSSVQTLRFCCGDLCLLRFCR